MVVMSGESLIPPNLENFHKISGVILPPAISSAVSSFEKSGFSLSSFGGIVWVQEYKSVPRNKRNATFFMSLSFIIQ